MKPFNSYSTAKVIASTRPRLPIGGYAVQILAAEELKYTWGNVLLISFDILEGEHKGFYANDYRLQMDPQKWKGTLRLNIPNDDGTEMDAWTANAFKTATNAIENSNAGYAWDWDETKLKGKIVGALMRNKEFEYNGDTGFFTECFKFMPIEDIRAGQFTMPKDKLLKQKKDEAKFDRLPDTDDTDLPFTFGND